MYTAHFGLKDNPFSITPDPRYLYMSPRHQEALAHLLYGVGENGGFVQLTGEVGTGKTTLIRTLLEQQIDDVDVALCLNPRLTVEELVATVCDELDANYPKGGQTLKPLVDALNSHLLETHARARRTVLIIDEAQNLSHEVLEQVRLLTNLETHRHKLLRIILVGQPELQDLLARQDLRQLAQRITARYHLTPLSRTETAAYIIHRLAVARGRTDLFTKAAIRSIYRRTQGIPRLINILCDRALLGAYAQARSNVDAATVRRAANESMQIPPRPRAGTFGHWLALGTAPLSVLLAALTLNWLHPAPQSAPVAPLASADSGSTETAENGSEGSDNDESTRAPDPANATKTGDTVSPHPTDLAALIAPATPAQDSATPTAADSFGASSPSATSSPSEAVASTRVDPTAAPSTPTQLTGTVAAAGGPQIASSPRMELEQLVFNADFPGDALAALLGMWGKQDIAKAGAPNCAQIQSDGLRCLTGQGDWDTLRRYNRPVILTLAAHDGRQREVLLRTLSDEVATLQIGQHPIRVTLDELAQSWTGDYLLVWRMQTSIPLIGPKSWGDSVQWLRQRLALAEGSGTLPDEPLSKKFDSELGDRIKQFQSAHGLSPDGVVGEFTMPLLNNAAPAPGTPFLDPPPVAGMQ